MGEDKHMAALVDANEFGNHIRSGGWRLGLLVARSVSKGNDAAGRAPHRISAREFAKRAGMSDHKIVLRYLVAWDAAAKAGEVPPASELVPGQDIDLPDAELWTKYYPPTMPQVGTTVAERESIASQAQEDGLSPAQVVRVASNPRAIEAAIKSSPKVAEAAARALASTPKGRVTVAQASEAARAAEVKPERREAVSPAPAYDRRVDAIAVMRKASRAFLEVVEAVAAIAPDATNAEVSKVSQFTTWIRNVADGLDSAIKGGSLEAEFAALLSEEGEL